MLRQQGKQAHSSDPSTTTNVMSFSVEGLLEVLDRALKYILSSLQVLALADALRHPFVVVHRSSFPYR